MLKFPWIETEMARARWMYVLGLGYLLIGYLGTNEIAAANPWARPALPIATEFDAMLPFTPWTVIFYVMYYPLLATPMFFAPNPLALTRLTLAQVVLNSFSYVIFLLFPTPINRPPAVPIEGYFHDILDLLFRADHPYNTFPSLHVAQTCILALFFLNYSGVRPFGATLHGIAANRFALGISVFHCASSFLVAASAVLIKQHYLADITSGALLAWIMSVIFFRKNTSPS